jgi:hypothetical protein
MNVRTLGITLLGVGLLLPVGAAGEDAVGRITSASGSITATGADGIVRPLECGDSVFPGDTLSTGTSSNVGVLSGDYLTQVPDSSAVRFARTDDGAPDATLQKGRVRVIDVRDGGGTARLAAADAEVRVAGNDAEAYLLSEKVGPYAMFCEWDAPLHVSRNAENHHASPGQCVIAKPREPLYAADAHDERISTSSFETCPSDLGGLAATDHHFSPDEIADVAAGPPPIAWSNIAEMPGPPARHPCETPGAVCGAAADTGGGMVLIEAGPGLGGGPGATTFPSGN